MNEFSVQPDTYGIIATETKNNLLGFIGLDLGVGVSHRPFVSSERLV